MARTQAVDYERKRDAITAQAARLFAERGFAGASISELAEACSVSKSLVYHYYASKEAILYDVMRDHLDALGAAMAAVAPEARDPAEALSAIARALLKTYDGAANSQKVLLYELNALPATARAEIVDDQRAIIAAVEDVLARLSPALADDRARRRVTAMLFFGMLNWTHTWRRADGPIDRDAIADMAATTVLRALA
ncbi:MAG: TetR/AcrR family transcriptional regulator [Pseudomonadota bacterium]